MQKKSENFIYSFLLISFFTSIIFSINGCYYDNEEELYGIVICDTANVVYKNQIETIVQVHCATTGCHVAGGSGNGLLESYDNVKAKVDNGSFLERVVVQKNMPPSAPLNDCQTQQIQAWIDAGAPKE